MSETHPEKYRQPRPITKEHGARLIAFDGGGVKGISALLLLDTIMERVKDAEIKSGVNTSEEDRLPANYFHLAAGTSTGGLIAILLFRLHLSTKEAVVIYRRLGEDVFSPRIFGFQLSKLGAVGDAFGAGWIWVKFLFKRAKFDAEPLKQAVSQVVGKYGLDDADKASKGAAKLKNPNSGKVLICATLTEKSESILFRTYDRPRDAKPVGSKIKNILDSVDEIDIDTAARATSAAPVYLPQVHFPDDNSVKPEEQVIFWDGGLLNNNPIDQLWRARYDLVGLGDQPPPVALVVSLGCSWSTAKPNSIFGFVNTITEATAYTTNTEAKNRDFQRYVNVIAGRNDINNDMLYRRLNTPTENEQFDLADYRKMDRLCEVTRAYIKSEEGQERIGDIVRVLAGADTKEVNLQELQPIQKVDPESSSGSGYDCGTSQAGACEDSQEASLTDKSLPLAFPLGTYTGSYSSSTRGGSLEPDAEPESSESTPDAFPLGTYTGSCRREVSTA